MYLIPIRKEIPENEFIDVCSMDEEDKENNSTKTLKRNSLTTSNYCTLLTATGNFFYIFYTYVCIR